MPGKAVLKKTLSRGEVLSFFANTPISLVGIEACAGAHYWARELIKLGHDARRMTVNADGQKWRVAYALLYRVLNSSKAQTINGQLDKP